MFIENRRSCSELGEVGFQSVEAFVERFNRIFHNLLCTWSANARLDEAGTYFQFICYVVGDAGRFSRQDTERITHLGVIRLSEGWRST